MCKLDHIQKFYTNSWCKGHNPCCKFSNIVDLKKIQIKVENLKGKKMPTSS